jgi:acyl-CoA-binding protein
MNDERARVINNKLCVTRDIFELLRAVEKQNEGKLPGFIPMTQGKKWEHHAELRKWATANPNKYMACIRSGYGLLPG